MTANLLVSLISPHYPAEKLDEPSHDDLVDVLEDRLLYWVVKPAQRLAGMPFGQYASIALILPYFEAMPYYTHGEDSFRRGREVFAFGFGDVMVKTGCSDSVLKEIAGVLYQDGRCGTAHDLMTRERVYIGDIADEALRVTIPKTDGEVDITKGIESIVINPREFCVWVEKHLESTIESLRDLKGDDRMRFHERCRHKWKFDEQPQVIVPPEPV